MITFLHIIQLSHWLCRGLRYRRFYYTVVTVVIPFGYYHNMCWTGSSHPLGNLRVVHVYTFAITVHTIPLQHLKHVIQTKVLIIVKIQDSVRELY